MNVEKTNKKNKHKTPKLKENKKYCIDFISRFLKKEFNTYVILGSTCL